MLQLLRALIEVSYAEYAREYLRNLSARTLHEIDAPVAAAGDYHREFGSDPCSPTRVSRIRFVHDLARTARTARALLQMV